MRVKGDDNLPYTYFTKVNIILEFNIALEKIFVVIKQKKSKKF